MTGTKRRRNGECLDIKASWTYLFGLETWAKFNMEGTRPQLKCSVKLIWVKRQPKTISEREAWAAVGHRKVAQASCDFFSIEFFAGADKWTVDFGAVTTRHRLSMPITRQPRAKPCTSLNISQDITAIRDGHLSIACIQVSKLPYSWVGRVV